MLQVQLGSVQPSTAPEELPSIGVPRALDGLVAVLHSVFVFSFIFFPPQAVRRTHYAAGNRGWTRTWRDACCLGLPSAVTTAVRGPAKVCLFVCFLPRAVKQTHRTGWTRTRETWPPPTSGRLVFVFSMANICINDCLVSGSDVALFTTEPNLCKKLVNASVGPCITSINEVEFIPWLLSLVPGP